MWNPSKLRSGDGARKGRTVTQRALVVGLMLAVARPVAGQGAATPLERGIVDEMNLARLDPPTYAAFLRALLPTFSGTLMHRPGEPDLQTQEGARAVQEAIAFLERQAPLDSLMLSPGLAAAARDHARDQAGGATGHAGSDGSDMAARIDRYGRWSGSAAENISYGSDSPRAVVLQLLIDDGVPSRGHRTNIFADRARYAGAGCGPHKIYGTVCVIDYAGGYLESGTRR